MKQPNNKKLLTQKDSIFQGMCIATKDSLEIQLTKSLSKKL